MSRSALAVFCAVLLLGAAGSATHEQFNLVASPLMRVHVPFGNVVLHPMDDGAMVTAIVDYPKGVNVAGHEDEDVINIGITRGIAVA